MSHMFRYAAVLLILCLAITRPLTTHAATFTIGCSNGVGDVLTLLGALTVANSNGAPDTINLTACLYSTPAPLTINADGGNPLTINGNNATIAGTPSMNGVITVTDNATLNLNKITITDGLRGIWNQLGTVTLVDSFILNHEGANGVGIYNEGTFTGTRLTISGNQATAMESKGGGIYNSGTLTINESQISRNSADDGGGIYQAAGSNATINDSMITDNTALGDGGGIYTNSGGTFTIINSTISNNSAPNIGGGIHNRSSLNARYSTFSNNSAGIGGAIFNIFGGITSLSNTTVVNNSANIDSGGGIYNDGFVIIYNSTFSGNDSTVVNNADTLDFLLLNSIIANSVGSDCIGEVNGFSNLLQTGGCGLTNGVNGNLIGVDPLLGAATGNPAYLPLLTDSPAINAGNNAAAQVGITRDQANRPRIIMTTVDMGAYEYAPPTSIALQLNLQGRANPPGNAWLVTAYVELRPTGSTDAYRTAVLDANTFGRVFMGDLYPGTYDLWVKGTHTLGVTLPITLIAGDTITGMSQLREGDADDNNLINVTDFSLLATAFGKTTGQDGFNAQADFNTDGIININDFSLLATNFNQAGMP